MSHISSLGSASVRGINLHSYRVQGWTLHFFLKDWSNFVQKIYKIGLTYLASCALENTLSGPIKMILTNFLKCWTDDFKKFFKVSYKEK